MFLPSVPSVVVRLFVVDFTSRIQPLLDAGGAYLFPSSKGAYRVCIISPNCPLDSLRLKEACKLDVRSCFQDHS